MKIEVKRKAGMLIALFYTATLIFSLVCFVVSLMLLTVITSKPREHHEQYAPLLIHILCLR